MATYYWKNLVANPAVRHLLSESLEIRRKSAKLSLTMRN
ncbi:uncharacterized protein PGTG_22167 [Puccinia graminis f. sp. tritici CRL 75-36-700-3]|uniref:Uncharacterized protein n=1 Tax=Puccinia graminis f. sp. tritici (strain CRL 75-36-700-3 / race SCCL) TaxID=418459 RepID=H6QTN5_PUCGT|nr:uncharacterized protein PGTG_22167 [Puccinia graminis f. sp. tritici CRL 75-36-700-3]EHS64250.1 hypothetical protein PGTG_22167 [Puccinia graminis f. sp. tritici CRL 75-36-700-3]